MTHEKGWRMPKLLIGTKSNSPSQFYRLLLIARNDEKYIKTCYGVLVFYQQFPQMPDMSQCAPFENLYQKITYSKLTFANLASLKKIIIH
jgi:hypothetical protein